MHYFQTVVWIIAWPGVSYKFKPPFRICTSPPGRENPLWRRDLAQSAGARSVQDQNVCLDLSISGVETHDPQPDIYNMQAPMFIGLSAMFQNLPFVNSRKRPLLKRPGRSPIYGCTILHVMDTGVAKNRIRFIRTEKERRSVATATRKAVQTLGFELRGL